MKTMMNTIYSFSFIVMIRLQQIFHITVTT